MHTRLSLGAVLAALFVCAGAAGARAQAESRAGTLEVGGHFSALNLRNYDETEPGFGARVTYNVTDHVSLEAEGNFFPRNRRLEGGQKTQGLFGVKAGRRFERFGIFAKARPGFVHFSEGKLRLKTEQVCAAVFPPPEGCVESGGTNAFAFDLGGVFELYPSRRTIFRVDVGDTVLHFGRNTLDEPSRRIRPDSFTRHNLQTSVGVGFRF